MTFTRMLRVLPLIVAGLLPAAAGRAQDVPGIEICTVEKNMARRTGCLQSNVEFLKSTMTRMTLDHQRKLDALARQVEALRATVASLRKDVDALQAARKKHEPARDGKGAARNATKDATKDAPKDDGGTAKK